MQTNLVKGTPSIVCLHEKKEVVKMNDIRPTALTIIYKILKHVSAFRDLTHTGTFLSCTFILNGLENKMNKKTNITSCQFNCIYTLLSFSVHV